MFSFSKFLKNKKTKHSVKHYQEIDTTMGELTQSDLVKNSSGNYVHISELLDIHIPNRMFRIHMKMPLNIKENGIESKYAGFVECSGTHEWTIYNGNIEEFKYLKYLLNIEDENSLENYDCVINNKICETITTEHLYEKWKYKSLEEEKSEKEKLDYANNIFFGRENGLILDCIEEIKPKEVRCIRLNRNQNPDMLFEIITSEGYPVLTHNCQQRLVCGQLGSVASRMALDDNQATTIDGTHKGAGMTKAQGIVNNIQYYFEEQKWIETWFKKRGLTEKGWEPGEDPDEEIDPSTIDLGEDEDLSIDIDRKEMEFAGIKKTIDNTKEQKFEEI